MPVYRATATGLMFKGYHQTKLDIQEAKDSARLAQLRGEEIATRLVDWTKHLADRTKELKNWTRAVAVGAIGLVVWEIIYSIFLPNKH